MNTIKVKFPHITVDLVGSDGNAFAIIAKVTKAMRKDGVDKHEIDDFTEKAMSGDYNNLLRVCMETVSVE